MIYFIRSGNDDGPIKIGYTAYDDALSRMQTLQIGNPEQLTLLGVMPGSMEDEDRLHIRFKDYRMRGEWFRANERLLAYVSANANAYEHVAPPWPYTYGNKRKELPSRETLMKLISVGGGRMFWKTRPPEMFPTPELHTSWNSRYAGREICGKTVAFDGKNYDINHVFRIVNEEASVVQKEHVSA